MRAFAMVTGIVCLVVVLLDAFQTIILPRRATGRFRLTRIFYMLTWRPWVFVASLLRDLRKRETFFSFYGPLSLILLLVLWAAGMVLGFALIYYSMGSPFHDATQRAGSAHRPLRERHDHLHPRPGRRDAADPALARTHHP